MNSHGDLESSELSTSDVPSSCFSIFVQYPHVPSFPSVTEFTLSSVSRHEKLHYFSSTSIQYRRRSGPWTRLDPEFQNAFHFSIHLEPFAENSFIVDSCPGNEQNMLQWFRGEKSLSDNHEVGRWSRLSDKDRKSNLSVYDFRNLNSPRIVFFLLSSGYSAFCSFCHWRGLTTMVKWLKIDED